MKLSLGALRKRQRLRLRVPESPTSFVNALQAGSFGIWVHFRKVRRQPFLLPIREGLPVIPRLGIRGPFTPVLAKLEVILFDLLHPGWRDGSCKIPSGSRRRRSGDTLTIDNQ